MAVTLHCADFCMTEEEVSRLWNATCIHMKAEDFPMNVSCVSSQKMTELNRTYRGKDAPTNVLTFRHQEGEAFPEGSEEESHDVVLCRDVAVREAQERGMTEKDYTALLLVHGFLHALGLDHEASEEAQEQMTSAEETILQQAGFSANHL